MREGRFSMRLSAALCVVACWMIPVAAQGQIANIVGSVGAINQSMGGAATAMPLDASGSQYWNPAGVTDLETTELDLNIEPYFPEITLNSTLEAGSLGPGFPPQTLTGQVNSRAKFAIVPSIAYIKKIEAHPSWRLGYLITGVGGTAVHFDHLGDDPVTSKPPIGSGDIKISGEFLQIAPTLAYRFGKYFSVGVQPSYNLSSLKASPFAAAPPKDFNGDGIPTYPVGYKAWSSGIGVQGGIYFHRESIHLGAAIKSPLWFLPYHVKVKYENSIWREVTTNANFPMIVSAGMGYSGIPRTKIAVDARFVDFANTTGFDKVGFTRSLAGKGPGWKSVWALACGVQYQATKRFSVRAGYAYNPMPIRPIYAAFSISSPSVIQQQMMLGFSYQFNDRFTLATSYHHGFAHTIEGPLQSPSGPIPGSNIKFKALINSFVISLLFKR